MERPYISYKNKNGKRVNLTYPSYRLLKKSLSEHFKNIKYSLNRDDNYIYVYRKRKGGCGEWFEIWQSPTQKIKEGWS